MKLPGVLGLICDIAGVDAALAVARARGGTRAYFPARPEPDHWTVTALGQELAERICGELVSAKTGVEIDVPFGPTGSWAEIRRRVARMDEAGHSAPEIARACGVTDRSVRRSRARRRDERQGTLL